MVSSNQHRVISKKLSNGAEGLFIDVPGATVMTFEFNFRAGYYLMDTEKWETPHVMEHLSLGANAKYPKARLFNAEFNKNGSYSNAFTSTYHVWYESECADFEWDRILDLLALSFSEPRFLSEEFNAEIGNVRDELTRYLNDNGRVLNTAMHKAFGLASVSYKKRIELLDNIKLKDIIEHHKKTHTTSNLRFIIAGNLKGRMTHIESVLSSIQLPKGRKRFDLPDEIPNSPSKVVYLPRRNVSNVYFDISTFAKTKFSDEQWDAASIANNILTETLHSKIFGEARERGLVYSMGSGFSQSKSHVDWGVGGQAQQANLPALVDIIVRELSKMKSGDIDEADIEAAKQYALGRFQRSAQTVYGLMSGYSNRYFFEGQVNDYFGFPERLKKAKKSDVVDVMRQMFSDGIWGVGMLGTADEQLRNQTQEKLSVLWQN